jgi:bis(5'-nucleosyl)-tetraphosphatase (symmetrical)
MNYLVGDVQGCCDALDRLLALVDFSPSRDRVYLLGDLVNRGPRSLATLRRVQGLGDAATCLLGNHDLHLLATAAGRRGVHVTDTIDDILAAPDRDALLDWVRHQRMACHEHGWLMVHAGVVPQWDLALTLELSGEVERMLRSDELSGFLNVMYGSEPQRWDPALEGAMRLRFIINVLTRVRFVADDGTLDLQTKEGAGGAPAGFRPWFDVPGRRTAGVPIAFGHWSTLGLVNRPDLLALDTGCVWGGALTAARIDGLEREVFQVPCPQARKPGRSATAQAA